jgi:hypothetical protein
MPGTDLVMNWKNEEFSNALLKTTALSFLSQMTCVLLVYYSISSLGVSWLVILPKMEVAMALWVIENMIFLLAGVMVRYMR